MSLLAPVIAALRALPWVARGLRTGPRQVLRAGSGGAVRRARAAGVRARCSPRPTPRSPRSSTRSRPRSRSTPCVRWIFLFAFGTAGRRRRLLPAGRAPARAVRPRTRAPPGCACLDWALPTGVLVAVLALFVGVQFVVLFGSDDYVLRTTGLTYAEYARSGFWQLLAVTALALGVLALGSRLGARPHACRAGRQAGPARRAGAAHPGRRRVGDQPDVALPAGVRLHRAAAARADLRAVARRGLPAGAGRRAAAAARRPLPPDGGRRDARPARPGGARRGAVHRRAQRGAVVGDRQARHLLPGHPLRRRRARARRPAAGHAATASSSTSATASQTPDDWRSTNVAREAARAELDRLHPTCARPE